ncbi:MAG TPA: sugar isomerase, partial [Plasticicumulans sp.]|nr:sugar isomerase [Plasticicumulans sp.]
GADLVAITGAGSPLAALATVAITVPAGAAAPGPLPGGSRVVDLAIVDALAIGVALRRTPLIPESTGLET